MTDRSGTPMSIVEGWDAYQRHIAGAIEPLSSEQLALSAGPNLRSIGLLAAHIISARVWWFHYVLKEGSPDLAPMVEWDEDYAPARSARELVDGLKSTWQVMREAMVRWTSEDLDAIFERPNRPERTYTRGWVIWHVLEHDLHHGGELAYSLGMHGLEAPDI